MKIFDWNAAPGDTACVLQLLHGLGEHAERYQRFAKSCNKKRIAVVAHNHRGHGSSDNYGHFADRRGWDKVIADVLTVREDIARRYPDQPIVLFGHSMGSYIAQSFVMRHGGDYAALILSGSTLASRVQLRAGNIAARILSATQGGRQVSRFLNREGLGKFNDRFQPVRTNSDWLSRDAAEVDRFIADPLCGEAFSNRLWADLTGGLLEVTSDAAIASVDTDLPIMIVGGEADPVGGRNGMTRLADTYRRTGHRDVELKVYPDGRHEMLNEINRNTVTSDIITWIQKKAPTLR